MRIRLSPLVLLLCLGLVMPGWGDAGGDGSGGGPEDDVFIDELELQEGARVVEASVRDDALIRSDDETGEYVFDAAALASAGVEIGVIWFPSPFVAHKNGPSGRRALKSTAVIVEYGVWRLPQAIVLARYVSAG